jgi:hypothetical protein
MAAKGITAESGRFVLPGQYWKSDGSFRVIAIPWIGLKRDLSRENRYPNHESNSGPENYGSWGHTSAPVWNPGNVIHHCIVNDMRYCRIYLKSVPHFPSIRHEPQGIRRLQQFFHLGFEVFQAVTMKSAVFWDVAPCGFIINRRFGGTYRFDLQDRRNNASEEKYKTVTNSLPPPPSKVIIRAFSASKLQSVC